MSFDSLEKSIDSGRPRTFFEFIYGDGRGDVLRYVGSTKTLIVGTPAPLIALNRSWTPRAIRHGAITSSGTLDKSAVEVTAGSDIELGDFFRAAPPSRQVQLNIYRGHVGSDEYRRIWAGRVLNAAFEGPEVKFSCEPVSTSIRRVGLRRNYQYGCPHVLYGEACGLSRAANTAKGQLKTVIDGQNAVLELSTRSLVLKAAEVIGGVFTVSLPDGRTTRRAVVRAVDVPGGIRVKLMSVTPELKEGLTATISRGCAHNWDACKRFGNQLNYGGFPHIPSKNPFMTNTF